MAEVSYINCQVTVHNERVLSYKADFAEELRNVPLGGDALTLLTIERLAAWVDADPLCSREHLELLGKHLYRCMFGAQDSVVHQRFQAALRELKADDRKNLRLRLTLAFEPDASRLASYPWEFLHVEHPDGDFFISAPSTATQLVLTRFVPPPPEVVNSLEPDERPLKILVVVASPTAPELGTVNPEMLLPRLEKLRSKDVDVRILSNPRLAEINDEFGRETESPWWPHIFHFVGHGNVRSSGGVVAIRMSKEDEDRQFGDKGNRTLDVDWVPTTKLQELFPADHRPRLVFLHACRGAKRESYRAFASGAEAFVKAGVPAAIAMQYDIDNEEADYFAQQFYEGLGKGWPVDDAVTAARVQLARRTAPDSWGDRRFGTPLLFLQSRQAVILRPTKPAPEPTKPAEAYDCPYRYDRNRLCNRLVHRDLEQCPKCGGDLQWCANGHPCMADDRRCSSCGVDLPKASPTQRPQAAVRGASSFG